MAPLYLNADLFVLDQIIWIVLVFVVNAEYFRIIHIIHTGVIQFRVGIIGINFRRAPVIRISLIPFSTQYFGQKHVLVSIFVCTCVQIGIFGVSGKICPITQQSSNSFACQTCIKIIFTNIVDVIGLRAMK